MISSNMFLLNIVYGMFGVLSPVEVSDSARESGPRKCHDAR